MRRDPQTVGLRHMTLEDRKATGPPKGDTVSVTWALAGTRPTTPPPRIVPAMDKWASTASERRGPNHGLPKSSREVCNVRKDGH